MQCSGLHSVQVADTKKLPQLFVQRKGKHTPQSGRCRRCICTNAADSEEMEECVGVMKELRIWRSEIQTQEQGE